MRMEQYGGGGQIKSVEDNKMGLQNLMQILLFEAIGEDGEDLGSFIDKHGAQIREIFEKNPGLVDEFKENPEGAIKKLAEKLKSEKIVYH